MRAFAFPADAEPTRSFTELAWIGDPSALWGSVSGGPGVVFAADCLSNSLNALAIAMAPLIPVPATRQITVLYFAGSAMVK